MAVREMVSEGGCSERIRIFEVAVLTLLSCIARGIIHTDYRIFLYTENRGLCSIQHTAYSWKVTNYTIANIKECKRS